jgi:hypothetical protein
MLCFRFFLLLAIAIYSLAAEAQPLAYQQCADIQLEKFRKDEFSASKELLHSLAELSRFPEMQQTVKKNYEFGLRLRQQHLDVALKVSKVLCTG